MTDLARLTSSTVAALHALSDSGDLSPRAGQGCAALIDKLHAPVRIGLLGLPGSGKRALLGALAGLPPDLLEAPLPTLDLSQGPRIATRAMLADGSRMDADGLPDAGLLAQRPVFLQVTTPDPALAGRRLLLVVTDPSAGDMLAGLRWAASRVDLALWCTRGWTGFERQVWQAAPDDLRNHALMVGTGDSTPTPSADDGFEAVFHAAGATDLPPLSDHLDRLIGDARLQDLHAAQMLLQRYGIRPDTTGAPPPADTVVPMPAAPAKTPAPTAAAADLARLVHMLRDAAADLLQRVETGQTGPEAVLGTLEEIFETLAARAATLDSLHDSWPDLATDLADAQDLALLLRIEGGADEVTDAARLLLQVRHDMETRLAA